MTQSRRSHETAVRHPPAEPDARRARGQPVRQERKGRRGLAPRPQQMLVCIQNHPGAPTVRHDDRRPRGRRPGQRPQNVHVNRPREDPARSPPRPEPTSRGTAENRRSGNECPQALGRQRQLADHVRRGKTPRNRAGQPRRSTAPVNRAQPRLPIHAGPRR